MDKKYIDNLAYNCIDKLPYCVQISDDEKETILTQIGAFTPKPGYAKQTAMVMLSIVMIITFGVGMLNIGNVWGIVNIIVFLVATPSLILLYFLGGIWSYKDWKQCVKDIRNNDVYKVKVVPRRVWQGEGLYKNFYMDIIGANGEELEGSYLISEELAKKRDKVSVWAYYHKSADRYGKFKIYLVGWDNE